MTEPTPEEAAAALRTIREGRDRVIRSAIGSRWLPIIGSLIVFGYCAVNDLVPATRPWLTWALLAVCLALVIGLRTRVGSSLLGRQVTVSSRSLPIAVKWRLLYLAPIFGIAIVVALTIQLLHVAHGGIYYGALAGLYIIFLGPRFQWWLLHRQDKD